jgi:hypothetical protein
MVSVKYRLNKERNKMAHLFSSGALLMVVLFFVIVDGATAQTTEDQAWETVAQKLKLDIKDIELLEKNKLLITNKTFKQVFQPYLEGDVPFFITTDSLLNAYHVLYEESILRMEKANARKLPEILQSIYTNLEGVSKQWKGNNELLTEAKKRTTIIIGTALRLLDDGFGIDDEKVDGIIGQEIKKIVEAKTKEMPIWLGKADRTFLGLDYSRYKPRGFYTQSDDLSRYFRAVAWLQSIPFRVSKDEELASILLLASSLSKGGAGYTSDVPSDYRHFFRAYTMFIGPGDDWGIMYAIFVAGRINKYDLSKEALQQTKEELMKRAIENKTGRQINDQLRFAPIDPNATAEANFRIISAYLTPDAVLFHRTTDLRQFDRKLPDGLEVCTALGSSLARSKLTYSDKEKLLKTIDQAKSLFSGHSLYLGYLNCLEVLLDEPEKDSPLFMKNEPWQIKSCNTVLAGWAQLRHTWVLQAKQSVMYAGITMPPTGFVEPEPEFFSRLAILAGRTKEILEQTQTFSMSYDETAAMLIEVAELLEKAKTRENLGEQRRKISKEKLLRLETGFMIMHEVVDRDDREDLLKAARKLREIAGNLQKGNIPQEPRLQRVLSEYQVDLKPLWESLIETCQRLEMLAHKQLRGKQWNQQDELFIKGYGVRLAKMMLYGGNAYLSPRDDAPRIVDVYSNPYILKGILHVGIGRARTIYVLYPWQGKDILCLGAVMPYYEFAHNDRLTDTEWKLLLDSDKRPDVPNWVTPIFRNVSGTK